MDLKRLTEWLGTADGLVKALIAVVAGLASVWVAAKEALTFLGPQPWISRTAAALTVTALGWLLWRSYRRFAQASRLERPDAFTLRPTGPESLIGRDEDLEKLVKCVKRNRLVLLDGESGCGKSALVSAGLAPVLQGSVGLLPLLIRDWGEDWERGPLAAALDALSQGVSQTERERLNWTASPDLAADTIALAVDLDVRLRAVVDTLGRRPLVIADQFDDYQARHRARFLDDEASWLAPVALGRVNTFWKLINTQLGEGRLHLLVITRSDTAAGLACVRFLAEDLTSSRTLPRVEVDYLRPLLARIAPDDASPAVVSNPAHGWHELRDALERDLKAEGAILMQQVRTVLLGLRQLPLLTLRRYRAAGGLRGVETLVITRAIRRAGSAQGGGEAGVRTARSLLGALVLPGGPNQPPKARRASFVSLCQVAGDPPRSEALLRMLQDDEVVRPAEATYEVSVWQLDHDYLARAVLADARRADRWALALHEGKARYDDAGDWRRRWAALLPVRTLVRIWWERARGRLTLSEAVGYARISTVKPIAAVACLVLIGLASYIVYQNRRLTAEATRLVDRFGVGGTREAEAVLSVWRAPEQLRQRVYDLVRADDVRLKRGTDSQWPSAHAAFEPTRVREAVAALRSRLENDWEVKDEEKLVKAYGAVVARLPDPTDVKAELAGLRTLLEKDPTRVAAHRFVDAYATVAVSLTDPAGVKDEATRLRARLEKETAYLPVSLFARAYAAVAARLSDPAAVREATAALRARLENEPNRSLADLFAHAYAAVAARLTEPVAVKHEAAALRARLEGEPDRRLASVLARAYGTVVQRLSDPEEMRAAAATLRVRTETEPDRSIASELAQTYATVAARLSDPPELKAGATMLRAGLERQTPNSPGLQAFTQAYVTVAERLNDQAAVKQEAIALRRRLETNDSIAPYFGQAYAAVTAQLSDAVAVRDEAKALRARLEKAGNVPSGRVLAHAYAAVGSMLSDPAFVKDEVGALRAWFEREPNGFITGYVAQAYAAVAARLSDSAAVTEEVKALRARLEREPAGSYAWPFLAQAYVAVTGRLTDPAMVTDEMTSLRRRLEKNQDAFGTSYFVQAYTALAVRLGDPAAIRDETAALRARLEMTRDVSSVSDLARAYAAVAARLSDPAVVKSEVAALRARFEGETDSFIAGHLVRSYTTVAMRLSDPAAVTEETTALRMRVERDSSSLAGSLARAYASLAGGMLERSEAKNHSAWVVGILTLAGHPLLADARPLLAALKPAAGQDFGGDVGAAVRWAQQTYGIKPSQLRPPPQS